MVVLLRKFDPLQTLRLIDRFKINAWTAVPTMLKRMASLPEEVVRQFDFGSIRMLSVGAAPITMDLKKWVIDHFGEGKLYQPA